jgi:hypothetical protein
VNGRGVTFVDRVFPDNNREAPAIFKYDGYYYFITSGTTGWDPNPSIAYRANHIFGNTSDGGQTFTGYTRLGNPFPLDGSNTSYRSQSTAVIPYDPENGLFIYMGDRWIQRSLETSGYVWLPLKISGNGTVVEGVPVSDWKLEQLDQYAPIKVLTPSTDTSKLGEMPNLPSVLDVQRGSKVYRDVPVTWDASGVESARLMLGKALVRGTLGGELAELAGRTVEYEIAVGLPEQTIYFVNPAHGEVTEYTQLVNRFRQETGQELRHTIHEQDYDPANGKTWGYVGTNSEIRDDTESIFESLRYETNQGDRSLTYKFDLEQGIYNVYIGFYDPWYQWSQGKRLAYTKINGVVVEEYRNISDKYEIAEHTDIELSEDGTLTVTVSPHNTGRDTDVQLSFIVITRVGPEPEPDTVKPVITLLGEPLVQLYIGDLYTDAGAIAWDDRDGDLTDQIEVTVTSSVYGRVDRVDTSYADEYTIRYNVRDSAGNAADEVTRTVIVSMKDDDPEEPEEPEEPVEPDVTKPVITLEGSAKVEVYVGDSYTDAGATAEDDRDGDITHLIEVTIIREGYGPVDKVDTSITAAYTIRYNVRDAAGNAADEVTRTVIVRSRPVDYPISPVTNPPEGWNPPPMTPVPSPLTVQPDGLITVQVAPETDGVQVPFGIVEQIGDQMLILQLGNQMQLEIDKAILESLFSTIEDPAASNYSLLFFLKRLPDEEIEDLVIQTPLSVQIRLLGHVYDLQVALLSTNGELTVINDFPKPITLTISIPSDAIPHLLGIYQITENGEPVYVGGVLGEGVIQAQLDHFSQYALLEYDRNFIDVDESLWAHDVIKGVAAKHVMQGVSEDRFDPHGLVTRAQFTTMIARALRLSASEPSPFTDVPADTWYADAVSAAYAAGIVSGWSETVFAPGAYITRQEMAAMLVRAYQYATGKKPSAAQAPGYRDVDQISEWAKEAVLAAQAIGLMKGRGDNRFDPQSFVTRAEGAQAIWNFLTLP